MEGGEVTGWMRASEVAVGRTEQRVGETDSIVPRRCSSGSGCEEGADPRDPLLLDQDPRFHPRYNGEPKQDFRQGSRMDNLASRKMILVFFQWQYPSQYLICQ